ncbi:MULTISPECIES: hypothetical protein [Corynebacterium]|uniref:Transcriptional regulator n=1 Tax=Corynebacterium accolens TaxID=38284 RepID=A0ABT7FR17_9CORY|nr:MULTISPECIES: hypothetical protein [Corynebacterium]ERS41904.1 hypothetical protein HMPREF1293_02060 [Corynebacterium sp. KPL1996]ERS44733.1 hypothetical protein HMPREF1287_01231 [Corynebacterium sp. KPL1986]ERS51948.1 hypothetical protein HMPREF1267_02071 [Corynebacterium sp. KPL1824]ERS72658.1 hypothetical protein HMPREF1295_01590 [Corynebacterium sp. KPL1998]ERS73883.1 hypothetical protein HMPREF1300_00861 [Corynebacterium sp. KPL2004]
MHEDQKKRRVKVRWWHIALVIFFVVLFLFLAYWQWTRFRSGSGTFQNLGYAFQWPLFAVFVVYAYRTTLRYENERLAAENEAREMDSLQASKNASENVGSESGSIGGDSAAGSEAGSSMGRGSAEKTAIDEDFLPQRPQLNVEEFNALNQPRRRRGSPAEGRGEGPTDKRRK